MKNTILALLTLFFLGGFSMNSNAQYDEAIGVRGALFGGISFKKNIKSDAFIEALLVTRYQGFVLTGLYEIQGPISGLDNFYLYYGGGASVGYFDGTINNPWYDDGRSSAFLGVDGIIGLEYVLEDFPLNLSVDFKPYFNIIGNARFNPNGALTVRYIIN